MANTFSARPQDLELDLSNGATDVFLDVLTLAGGVGRLARAAHAGRDRPVHTPPALRR
jgi:hypothetical protein